MSASAAQEISKVIMRPLYFIVSSLTYFPVQSNLIQILLACKDIRPDLIAETGPKGSRVPHQAFNY